jgi:transmembrane sensor
MTGTEQDEGDARAQAAQWLARLNDRQVSNETVRAFFAWRRTPEHRRAYEEAEQVWGQARTLSEHPEIKRITEDAWHRSDSAKPRRRVRRGPIAVLLASGALAAGIAYVGLQVRPATYQTRTNESRTIALDDGSRVTLDTASEVAVRYTAHARRLWLRHGQAYFEVAHNAGRPFTVDADGTVVTATGTAFDVRNDKAQVAVVLVQGSVAIASGSRPAERLQAGQQWLGGGGARAAIRPVDTNLATAWKADRIILDGRTLTDAIAEVNRYTTHPVVLDAPAYADSQLGGSLATGDVAAFLAATQALLPLTADRRPDGTIHLIEKQG